MAGATATPRTFPVEEARRTFKLTLGYRGTHFSGWASQAPARLPPPRTVQGELEKALQVVLDQAVPVIAAGRTDAGTHAEGQVVSFTAATPVPSEGLGHLLARALPEDMWLVDLAEAPVGFDARRWALRRWYRYTLWIGANPPPRLRGRCWPYPGALDVGLLRAAARDLLGRSDRSALASGQARDTRPGRSLIRSVYAADWLEDWRGQLLTLEICGDAFVRQMVRTAVGSMVRVGERRWSLERFREVLSRGYRREAGPSAPSSGLTLMRIEYTPEA